MSVFLALGLTLVVAAGGKNTMAVFLPSTGNAHGLGSVITASIFALIGAVLTILVVATYVTTSISCIVYYLRERRSEFNVILHLLVPAVSALAFLTVLVASFGINFAGLGIQPLTYPASLAPWICVAWLLLGLLRLVSLRRTAPGSLSEMGSIFAQGETHDESVVNSTPDQ